jgi:hypothetical protein
LIAPKSADSGNDEDDDNDVDDGDEFCVIWSGYFCAKIFQNVTGFSLDNLHCAKFSGFLANCCSGWSCLGFLF